MHTHTFDKVNVRQCFDEYIPVKNLLNIYNNSNITTVI